MPRLKRTRDEAEQDLQTMTDVPPEQEAMLSRLRNMWEFASFMQYIFLFGHAVKIDDDFDVEDLEAECLQPSPSDKLAHIGLQLLKFVSSHREIFDEYARRQYMAKASHRNPFGEEEEPNKFNDFDIYMRIKVLHQLSIWTLGNAEKMRGLMPLDEDQLNWRMEPLGWDKDDRSYFVLDDNRLYRREDRLPPPPTARKPKPKATPKKKAKYVPKGRSKGTRSSKRLKIEESDEDTDMRDVGADEEEDDHAEDTEKAEAGDDEPTYGFTNKTWECVAITLEEYQVFLASLARTRDPNEKELRDRLEEEVLPIIEKRAEAVRQKQLKKLRELENLHKMATAKRSSRLAGKAEREKQEREEREAEEKRQRGLRMAHEEQERQRKIEEAHESRRMTREQRLREREAKRILHEEELARLEEEETRASSLDPSHDSTTDGSKRISERHLKTQRDQHKKELEKLAEEEENWIFDCAVCGVHGENLDDGTHSMACEKCNVWQHSKCHGFTPKQAEDDGFHFICATCKRKEREAKMPKIAPLKLKSTTGSPEIKTKQPTSRPSTADRPRSSGLPEHIQRQLDYVEVPPPSSSNPPTLSHTTTAAAHAPPQPTLPYAYSPNNSINTYAHQHGLPGGQRSPVQLPPSPLAVQAQRAQYSSGAHPQHHEQHRQMHEQAVASSHGHPSQPFQYYNPAVNGHGPQLPPIQHQMNHSPPYPHEPRLHPPPNLPPPDQLPRPSPSQPYLNSERPAQGISPRNPGTSPQKHPEATPRPVSYVESSPRPTYRQSSGPYSAAWTQHEAVNGSPIKSSSPPQPIHPRPYPSASQSPPNFFQTPQPGRPLPTNGYDPKLYSTPIAQPNPSAASAHGIAEGGMSGPWPRSNEIIPQKHDRSPAPPTSSQTLSETKVIPPVAPLMPSPHQRNQVVGPESVPVKKVAEVNGVAHSSSSPLGNGASNPNRT